MKIIIESEIINCTLLTITSRCKFKVDLQFVFHTFNNERCGFGTIIFVT